MHRSEWVVCLRVLLPPEIELHGSALGCVVVILEKNTGGVSLK